MSKDSDPRINKGNPRGNPKTLKDYYKTHDPWNKGITSNDPKYSEVCKSTEKARSVKRKPLTAWNPFLANRPTSYETGIINLCKEFDLPFEYVGDKSLYVRHKNPDFICEEHKLIIEVYNEYWKVRSGWKSGEHYEKWRAKLFEGAGYKTIFINDEDFNHPNWKSHCLTKIVDSLRQPIGIQA